MDAVIEKISQLLKKQGKKQKELTDYLGISQNAFTDWKSGRIRSYPKHLPKIAEFFGVSLDTLTRDEETEKSPQLQKAIYEDFIVYHRDGKTVTKRFSKEQMDILVAMIEAIPRGEE